MTDRHAKAPDLELGDTWDLGPAADRLPIENHNIGTPVGAFGPAPKECAVVAVTADG